ncbi:MAG: hypothetical protein KatS3mg118_0462 [Paracoccaceae bacterium]|nr:MAG: hypothetical protein KatS3mg118_0462 [Paracoccaceae bacterium]
MTRTGLTLRAALAALRLGWQGLRNRLAARTARFGASPGACLWQPEARPLGSFQRAQELAAGLFRCAGREVRHAGSPWDIAPPDPDFAAALHAFGWLDDLAADGGQAARRLAQDWTLDWIARHGGGGGSGWTPELAGWRVMRWIGHLDFLTRGLAPDARRRLLRALGAQARFLAWRWHAAPPGLPRFVALAGLIHACLALERHARGLAGAVHDLGRECERRIGPDGGIASRNPEELAGILSLLVGLIRALEEAGKLPDPRHPAALRRIVPALRALRLGDGSLVRFHGGSEGAEGLVDQALADSKLRGIARGGAMGFQRLASGPAILVMDAERPPAGPDGHASTLGIEVSLGRRPLFGSIGPGRDFGPDWAQASRVSEAHSTLVIERLSSSRFVTTGLAARVLGPVLVDSPRNVATARTDDLNGAWIIAAHDGYVRDYGLVHERRLHLATSGLDLRGEDTLSARSPAERRSFDRMVAAAPRLGVAFSVVFHLHPDVEARMALADSAVALSWPDGETWLFRQSGGTLELQGSAWLDRRHPRPRATKRIVVTGRVVDYAGRVTWALRRATEGRRRSAAAGEEAAAGAGPGA